jgi:hypothetical protein
MKKLILFMAAGLYSIAVPGQGLTNGYVVPNPGLNTMVYTNNYVSTNVTGGGATYTNVFYTGAALYHSFEGGCVSLGTNTCTGSLDTTFDGTDWGNIASGVTLTNNLPFRTNVVGKILQARWRITLTATNANYFWNYAGQ